MKGRKKLPPVAFIVIGAGMILMSVLVGIREDNIEKFALFILAGAVLIVYGFFRFIVREKKQAKHLHHAAHHPAHHPAHHAAHKPAAKQQAKHPAKHAAHAHKAQPHKTPTHVHRCANCGVKLHPLFKFCPNCGQRMK